MCVANYPIVFSHLVLRMRYFVDIAYTTDTTNFSLTVSRRIRFHFSVFSLILDNAIFCYRQQRVIRVFSPPPQPRPHMQTSFPSFIPLTLNAVFFSVFFSHLCLFSFLYNFFVVFVTIDAILSSQSPFLLASQTCLQLVVPCATRCSTHRKVFFLLRRPIISQKGFSAKKTANY